MKTFLLFFILVNTSIFSQTALFNNTSENQTDYYRSHLNDLKNENGISILLNSNFSDSLILSGVGTNDKFGISVSSAGDVNGDGFSDVIVGAEGYNSYTGLAFIFYGGLIMDNIADVTLSGEGINNHFGFSVSSAGDLNGDGFSDVIVGAEGYNSGGGRAYIFYGGTEMNNLVDVVLTSEVLDNNFGFSVSKAGDVNNDGFSDVIVGSYGSLSHAGRAYIYYGGLIMDNVADVIISGESTNNELGYSVAEAGDVNGDGYSDVIVGASLFNSSKGQVYIFYGGLVMDNIADVTITGETAGDKFGSSVSSAGDVNGDGYSDVVIGANGFSFSKGRAYILYGGSSMNNIVDVTMTGEATLDLFGYSVSSAGDINGDSFTDVVIGTGSNHSNFKGRIYIFNGGSSMDNIADDTLRSQITGDNFGKSVSLAGDVNGNEFPDLIVGSYNPGYAGKAFLYFNVMTKPKLISPINKSLNNPLTISFIWRKYFTSPYYLLTISTDSIFNNIVYKDTIYFDTSKVLSIFQKNTKYFWNISAEDSNNVIKNSSTWNFTTIPPIMINLNVLIEGIYSPVFDQLTRKDTIGVYLRNSSPPYELLDSAKGIIDSISQSGLFNFVNASSGTYYIIGKHFNCLETWSKTGGETLFANGLSFNYDFTNTITQAFGSNLKLKGSKYCLYSGDIDQDGYINLSDVIPIYNDATLFVSGSYIVTDLTGDSIVDLSDVSLCYNNSVNFVGVIRP